MRGRKGEKKEKEKEKEEDDRAHSFDTAGKYGMQCITRKFEFNEK